jgi:hypothetical protein
MLLSAPLTVTITVWVALKKWESLTFTSYDSVRVWPADMKLKKLSVMPKLQATVPEPLIALSDCSVAVRACASVSWICCDSVAVSPPDQTAPPSCNHACTVWVSPRSMSWKPSVPVRVWVTAAGLLIDSVLDSVTNADAAPPV